MKRLIVLCGLSAGLFVTLAVIETLQSEGAFSTTEFAVDLFETSLLALAVAATVYVALEIHGMRRERADLLNDLVRARAEGEQWRAAVRGHLDGLGRAVDRQFRDWHLGEGEADVAMLVLKGLSHKEIARLRQTSEATVRQQAAAVYRKSGLTSRAEFAAFFLEDLFASQSERGTTSLAPLKLIDPKD